MANARKEVLTPDEISVFHCVSRCVRQAFLMGFDAILQKDYSHRKAFIQSHLIWIAAIFSVEITSFSIMSNHYHVVVRTRPDLVKEWTDEEVARRWLRLFSKRRKENGEPEEPTDAEISAIVTDGDRIRELRSRLSCLSWFMRCFNEPIARQSNREDGRKGRFFEGRFSCQRLVDEAALLTCMAYVDLNPVRAGMAETPETSENTSIYERIRSHPDLQGEAVPADGAEGICEVPQVIYEPVPAGVTPLVPILPVDRDGWLCSIPLSGDKPEKAERNQKRRASNLGALPISTEKYFAVVDWAGRTIRGDKPGAITADLAPILERLGLESEQLVSILQTFNHKSRRVIGNAEAVKQHAAKVGLSWFHGISWCRSAFPAKDKPKAQSQTAPHPA